MPKPRSRPSSDAQRRPPIRRDSTRVVNRLTTFPTHACWSEILKRSDGKDRVVGLIQYVAMVISGGRPGSVLTSIGFALNDARRPFRLYTPVAVLIDTFLAKGKPKAKGAMRTLECIKAISTAVYVTCDHVVWAGGAGAVDKRSTLYKVCDKLSLMGWAAGSALMAAGHVPDLIAYTRALRDPLTSDTKRDDDADEWELREELEEKTVAAALDVSSGLTQALFALSLLGATPLKGRQMQCVGLAMGIVGVMRQLVSVPLPPEKTGMGRMGRLPISPSTPMLR